MFRLRWLVIIFAMAISLATATKAIAQNRYVLPGSPADTILKLADVLDPVLGAAVRGGVFVPEDAQAQALVDVLTAAKILELQGYLRLPPSGTIPPPPPSFNDLLANVPRSSRTAFKDDADGSIGGDLGDLGGAGEVVRESGERTSSGWAYVEELERQMELEALGLSFKDIAELEYQGRRAEEAYVRARMESLLEERRKYLGGDPNNYLEYLTEIEIESNINPDLWNGRGLDGENRNLGGALDALLKSDREFGADGNFRLKPVDSINFGVPPEMVTYSPGMKPREKSSAVTSVRPPPTPEEEERRRITDPLTQDYWVGDPDGTDGDITEVNPSAGELEERWRRSQEAIRAARDRAKVERERRAAEETAAAETSEQEDGLDASGLPEIIFEPPDLEVDTSGITEFPDVAAGVGGASCAALRIPALCTLMSESFQGPCMEARQSAAAACDAGEALPDSCMASCLRNSEGMRLDEKLIDYALGTVEENARRMRQFLSAYPNSDDSMKVLSEWEEKSRSRWQNFLDGKVEARFCSGASIDDWTSQCQAACQSNGRNPQTKNCIGGFVSATIGLPTSAVFLRPPGYFLASP